MNRGAVGAPMARTRRERDLIQRFLTSYNAETCAHYTVEAWPDEDSSAQAIDALAVDSAFGSLAIEHTLIQPFAGEKQDSAILLKGLAALDQKTTLVEAGYDVTLTVKVGAVPKGVSWPAVALVVEKWYVSEFPNLPLGSSTHLIPDLQFALELDIDKEHTGEAGNVFVSRWMPAATVSTPVQRALETKLPKLVAAVADRRLLLLEKDSAVRSPDQIGAAIEDSKQLFPELVSLDEVWVINTVIWPAKDYTPAYLVWPRHLALAARRRKKRPRGVGAELCAADLELENCRVHSALVSCPIPRRWLTSVLCSHFAPTRHRNVREWPR
jgi:hypothetical protein